MKQSKPKIKIHSIETIINRIDVSNKQYGDKFKTAFYCDAPSGKEILCILWQPNSLCVGDKVLLNIYRIANSNAFIVTKIAIVERADSRHCEELATWQSKTKQLNPSLRADAKQSYEEGEKDVVNGD